MKIERYMRTRVSFRVIEGQPLGPVRGQVLGTPVEDPRWITRAVAAALADRDPRTIDRWVREGLVTVYKGPVPATETWPANNNGLRVWRDDVLAQAGKVEE